MSKSKYKYANGQAVRVRNDIETYQTYYMRSGPEPNSKQVSTGSQYSSGPYKFRGQIVHISHKTNGCYKIVEDGKNYYYVDDLFEPIKPFICKSLL